MTLRKLRKATNARTFAFFVHNLEETIGMERWITHTHHFINFPLTRAQLAIATGIFSALGFVLVSV